MAIPATQLEIWSKRGSRDLSSTTYQSIRSALTSNTSPIRDMISMGRIKVDLQGSYANDTNTKGDSDVDVLVRLDVFHSNKLVLPADQYQLHELTYPTSQYNWADLRRDVIIALESHFTPAYVDKAGNKSIKVLKNSGRLKADVVPVVTYRNYAYFLSDANHQKQEGVLFYHRMTNEEIINYPDQHYANGVVKHQTTSDAFKRIVRIIKNARAYAVDKGLLAEDLAPSYFLQSMIYNVPDPAFAGSDSDAVRGVLSHLYNNDISGFRTQSEQHPLFGDRSMHWKLADGRATIASLVKLWDGWDSL